ncbi:MAG TPA: CBS domain-containing protein [Vicinamibacteria bacterium]|nr:CBS domain-containing protein [Vicinamibacteria bacterium]
MALTVGEIMSKELFSVRPTDAAEDALNGILALGITGAPVLDDECRPLGMVSLRNFVGRRPGDRVADRMTTPAATLSVSASVAEAGRLLAETGRRRLTAVDAAGRAVGVVSALDVLRGLLGLPIVHPAPFPHMDLAAGFVWTDELPLEPAMFPAAVEGPGLLVLVHGGSGNPERIVWAEACDNVRARLQDMLAAPQTEEPLLAFWLKRPPLRFRAASALNSSERREAADALRRRARLPTTESWI